MREGRIKINKHTGTNSVQIYLTREAMDILSCEEVCVKMCGEYIVITRGTLDSVKSRKIQKTGNCGTVTWTCRDRSTAAMVVGEYYIDEEKKEEFILNPY